MEVYGVVYLIIDGTNDKEYVGQTIQPLEKRMAQHLHDNLYVDRVIRAHGADMFATAVLKECATKEELDFWERHFIYSRNTKHPNGYNMTDGGEGGIPCDEVRAKMSATRKGREVSAETRAKIAAALTGKPFTAERCAKIAAANTGKKHPHSPEHCANLSASLKGKIRSAEHCAKLSESHMGEKNPFFGKHHTNEHCVKLSKLYRGKTPYKNLIAELDAHNLSYAALAKLMNLPQSTISDKIRDKQKFKECDKTKLEEIFGKPADYLLKHEPYENTAKAHRDDSPYKNLLNELDARHMSYRALAKLLCVSHSNIACKMRGERNFTVKDKIKLEEIFGLPIDYLLERGADK